jgi:hypothetical protein
MLRVPAQGSLPRNHISDLGNASNTFSAPPWQLLCGMHDNAAVTLSTLLLMLQLQPVASSPLEHQHHVSS